MLRGHVRVSVTPLRPLSRSGESATRSGCHRPTWRPCTPARRKVYTSLNVSQDARLPCWVFSPASKRMFLQLQKVSGIGPKVVLSLLSTLPPERLAKAVADGDARGAWARRLVWAKRLHRRLSLNWQASIDLGQIRPEEDRSRKTPVGNRSMEGLMSLGWLQQDAVRGVRRAASIATPISAEDVPRVLKLALSSLDRGR